MATEKRPAQPRAILRGHKVQVHAVAFCRNNERLVTGDADGFLTAWDLAIMRPRAVWQAHANAILGVSGWGDDRLITHGRDNQLIVWKFAAEDEANLSTVLPLDPCAEARPRPWILYMLEVNTMNFCSFDWCPAALSTEISTPSEILVAVPNTLASESIDIFHLPSQSRRHTVHLGGENGMVMALSLFYRSNYLTLVAGYENGLALVVQLDSQSIWNITYKAQCHSQPVLSLDVSPNMDYFLTSSADDVIAKHPVPFSRPTDAPSDRPSKQADESASQMDGPSRGTEQRVQPQPGISLLAAGLSKQRASSAITPNEMRIETEPLKLVRTKHSGQQGLRVRSDGRLFATAGWDSKVRVYSAKSLKEVAVLKWHQVGCYATAFAVVQSAEEDVTSSRSSAVESEKKLTQASEAPLVVPKPGSLSVRDKRIGQAKTLHWLAAGSKDGRVSLWDIF